MGDKSPKAKQKGDKQKAAAQAQRKASANAKQVRYDRTLPTPGKGKR